MATKNCNYCSAPIGFTQNARMKWVPTDPATGKFHRCKLEQTCRDCLGKFEGAPWMTQCPECFKASNPNSRPGGGRERQRTKPRKEGPHKGPAEPLVPQDDFFNDIPF